MVFVAERLLCSRLVAGLYRVKAYQKPAGRAPIRALYALAVEQMVYSINKMRKGRMKVARAVMLA